MQWASPSRLRRPELTLDPREFEAIVVHLRDDPRRLLIGELRELRREPSRLQIHVAMLLPDDDIVHRFDYGLTNLNPARLQDRHEDSAELLEILLRVEHIHDFETACGLVAAVIETARGMTGPGLLQPTNDVIVLGLVHRDW